MEFFISFGKFGFSFGRNVYVSIFCNGIIYQVQKLKRKQDFYNGNPNVLIPKGTS